MAKYAQMILEKQHPLLEPIDQPMFVYVLTMREHGPYCAGTENIYQTRAVKLCPSGRRYKAQANLAFVVVDVGEKSITI